MKRCLKCMEEYEDSYEICPCCEGVDEGALNDGFSLQAGSILQGRYIVGAVIKERETDVFYIGWDALFDRKVQIQEFFPQYCAATRAGTQVTVDDWAKTLFEAGRALFLKYSRQLIRLYSEEDVITYHACFEENNTAYAIMDHRSDQTLKEYLDSQPIQGEAARRLLFKAARAVEKAHHVGVYHGDVGLDSFWVKSEDQLILKDFGAACYVSGEPGTKDCRRAGCGGDVYGLAMLFGQMAFGEETGVLKKPMDFRKKRPGADMGSLERIQRMKTSALSVLAGVTESVAAGAGRLKLQQGYRRMEDALMRARNAPGRDGADSKVETQEEQQSEAEAAMETGEMTEG